MRSDIFDAFSLMAKEKNIDRYILEGVIKEAFQKMMEKRFGEEAEIEINVNMERGSIEIFLMKSVVEMVEDPDREISIEEVKKLGEEDLEVGDEYAELIPIDDIGRRLVLNLKQTLNQKIREIEKETIFKKYNELIGEVIVSEIYQIKPTLIILMNEGNEVLFPYSEQIPKEKYRKGDTIRAIVKSVEKKSSGLPTVIASRAADQFLYKLFELEIPEIYDGIIEIKKIAREPGERAKVAVISNDDRIDAVGACVGMKGIRIHSIVRELSNENIDVINYSDDPVNYIARALAPAKIDDIYIDVEGKIAKIEAQSDQLSLIIGRNGQNIKLASALTGYQLEIIKYETADESKEEEDETEIENVYDDEDNEIAYDESDVDDGEESDNEENREDDYDDEDNDEGEIQSDENEIEEGNDRESNVNEESSVQDEADDEGQDKQTEDTGKGENKS